MDILQDRSARCQIAQPEPARGTPPPPFPGSSSRIGADVVEALQAIAGVLSGPLEICIRTANGSEVVVRSIAPSSDTSKPTAGTPRKPEPPLHDPNELVVSEDYRTVAYAGRYFHLSPLQAGVVKALAAAWRKGFPDVAQSILLRKAGSESTRLYDVFKRNSAWESIVIPGEACGTYRLVKKPATSPEVSTEAKVKA